VPLTGADIDLMIPHQANVRIIEATGEAREHPDGQGLRERRPLRQHVVGVDRHRARRGDRAGRVKEGSTVLLVAFGAGFTWGSMVVRF
jgi:3-oxoacyl-[acyl-carrier-protein] synthase-3